jgi:phosphoserine phosphatase RsbU/P
MAKETLFLELMRHMPDAIYFKDRNSRFLMISQSLADLQGVGDPESTVGKTDFDFFSKDQADRMFREEQEIMASGEAIIGEVEHEFMATGQELWFSTTKLPLCDNAGNTIGILGISRDITKQKQAEAELALANAALREQAAAMKTELERAELVQKRLLPSSAPQHPRLQVDYRYRPMRSVGGDYVAFVPMQQDRCLGVFISDLPGHGVSAALFTTVIKFVADHLFRTCGEAPDALICKMNEELTGQMPDHFMTALYGVFDEDASGTMRLRYAGGGHPQPILFRKSSGTVEQLPLASAGALCLFDEFTATLHHAELDAGDRLLIYTDGAREVVDAAGNILGRQGFLDIVKEANREAQVGGMLDAILAGVDRFRGEGAAVDDVTLIGVEVGT